MKWHITIKSENMDKEDWTDPEIDVDEIYILMIKPLPLEEKPFDYRFTQLHLTKEFILESNDKLLNRFISSAIREIK